MHHTEVDRKTGTLFESSSTVLERESKREGMEISDELKTLGVAWNPAEKDPDRRDRSGIKTLVDPFFSNLRNSCRRRPEAHPDG